MRKAVRAVAMVVKEKEILLIHRIKDSREYYVFPGGGVEGDESVEDAVLRELIEETSVNAKITKLIYRHDYGTSQQYYYLCEYESGKAELGESIEKQRNKLGKDLYKPMWVQISELSKLLVFPLEIRDWFIQDYRDGFKNTPREARLKIENLRQS